MRIRIAHFLWGRCNPDSSNGIDKAVYHLGRTQAAALHRVAIFSISDKPPIPVPGCEVRCYPPRRFPLPLGNRRLQDLLRDRSPLNLPPALTSDLLAWKPSIVHFHFVHLPQAIRIAHSLRECHIPYCVSPHGGLAVEAQHRGRWSKVLFGALFERAYLNNAAFIHAISTTDIEGVKTYGAHNRFILAPNGIDPSSIPGHLDGTVIRRRLPGIAGRRVFVFVGRIDPEQKGLDILLRSWAALPSREDLALVLVGPDWRRGRARLQLLADRLAIADSVKFLDAVSGQEKWDVLASADVFVHPSRWEAGVPFSVLEAMLAARPLLLTEPADPGGRVARAGGGVVASLAEEGLVEALSRLARANAGELQSFGRAARVLAHTEFRWERTTQKLLEAYEEAAGPDHR